MVWIKNNRWVLLGFVAIFIVALGVRALAFAQPYHQDEYKWAEAADPAYNLGDSIPHPPLALALYHVEGEVFGYGSLRAVPIAASLILLALLFAVMWRLYGSAAALGACAAYILAFYATLGSVQVDIDGALLPLITLLAIGGYLLWRQGLWRRAGLALLALGLVLGFILKLSFAVVPLAIVIDYAWQEPRMRALLRRKEVVIGIIAAIVIFAAALAVLWNKIGFLRYVDNFVALGGRDYFQILFLSVKAALYSSPLLIAALFLGWRHRRALGVWYIFLALNVLFYYVVFDFSHRTFDRYLMFIILPACIIAGYSLAQLWSEVRKREALPLMLGAGVLLGAVTYLLFSLPHRVIPLLPKSAFIEAFISGHWRFVLPMTGGSGPAGFYVPVDALALLWLVAAACVIALLFLPRSRTWALALLCAACLVYNIFITNEYLFGSFYGSAPQVINSLVSYVDAHPGQGSILTYNDTAAWPLLERGLYAGRFYPHEEFVSGNAVKFAGHDGEYLVVGIPELNDSSGYSAYFAACKALAGVQSGLIEGSLLDCRGVPASLIDR